MEVLVEAEVGEGFRGWARQEGGSPRLIRMDLGGTLVAMVDRVVMRTSFPALEAWAKAVEALAGTRVVELVEEADVMEGMGVPGETMIVIAIAITMGEVMTVEEGEVTIGVVGVVTVSVGEVAGVGVVEAAVGDTELLLCHTPFNPTMFIFVFHTSGIIAQQLNKTCDATIAGSETCYPVQLNPKDTRFFNYTLVIR